MTVGVRQLTLMMSIDRTTLTTAPHSFYLRRYQNHRRSRRLSLSPSNAQLRTTTKWLYQNLQRRGQGRTVLQGPRQQRASAASLKRTVLRSLKRTMSSSLSRCNSLECRADGMASSIFSHYLSLVLLGANQLFMCSNTKLMI